MAFLIKQVGKVHGVPLQDTPLAAGVWVAADGAVPGSAAETPVGILISDTPTDNPPTMLDAYGNGSIIEDTSLSLTPGDTLYSDGDGTISATPSEVVVGTALSATEIEVLITSVVNA